MQKKLLSIFFFCFFSIVLVSCAGVKTTPTPDQAQGPIPTQEPGKVTVTGRVLSTLDGKPFAKTPVRLAQVYREGDKGAFALDMANSPSAITDSNGSFTMYNVRPAEYLIVVGYPEDENYRIYQDRQGNPFTYTISAGQPFDLGDFKVDYKP